MDLFKDDDSSSSDENDQILSAGAKANAAGMGGDFMAFDDTANIMPLKPQDQIVLEEEMKDMNDFLEKINKFEKITNSRLIDLWQIKDTAFQPLRVSIDVQEYMPGLFDLLKPDDKNTLSKILSVFSFLQVETFNLKNEIEQKYFDTLILFGESGLVFEEIPEEKMGGEFEIQMSRMLAVYRDMFEIIKKTVALTKNIIYQMNGLFKGKSPIYDNLLKKNNVYNEIFDNLGSILSTLYTIDLIIMDNTNFQNYWQQYNKMLLLAKQNPAKFGMTDKKVRKIQKFCAKCYQNILCGQLFNNYLTGLVMSIEDDMKDPKALPKGFESPMKNKEFAEQFKRYLDSKVDKITTLLSNPYDMISHQEYMNLLMMYTMNRRLFKTKDEERDIYKKIWALQKFCPFIIIYNNLKLSPGVFLSTICPLTKKSNSLVPKDVRQFLTDDMKQRNANFQNNISQYYMRLVDWIMKMNSDSLRSEPKSDIRDFLERRANLLTVGINLAVQIKRTVKSLIMSHELTRTSLSPERLKDILQAVEMLKAIEIEFKTKKFIINQWVVLMNRNIADKINEILKYVPGIVQTKKLKDPLNLWLTYLAQTITKSLNGGFNLLRKTVVNHCKCLIFDNIFEKEQKQSFDFHTWQIDVIANWEWYVRKSTRCRFLYWNRSLFPTLFQSISKDKMRLNQLNFFTVALSDPLEMLINIKHLESPHVAIDNYKKEIFQAFTEKITTPVCKTIEEELRLQIHEIIIANLKQRNPCAQRIVDWSIYTRMSDIYLFEKRINIAEEVKHYLGKIFYEMTALYPHDWKTYQHMRILAKEKFAIDVIPSHLPSQTLEQSVDILFLLRNIQKYVTNYNYNLHTNVFIEITKETKQIKTISVNQMLYSIKTHGVGILGTAVNTIYKYLIKRFSHFSDFLYDDIIHSNLLREQRLFNKNKEKLNGQYPYERAEKLSKDIKKLGTLGKKNLTYLDTFRQLISTIGNALGIVRMIRNASLKDNSNLIRFIPKIIEDLKFEDVAEELGLKGETFEACKMFDISVRLLFKQEEDATDFLRILVKNFEGAFDGPDCAHLKLFHLILPSLTLNFIEHVMRGKDRIFKRNNKEAFISDDGFALGSSYLLKILDQTEAFKSLNWFQHMNEKFERDTQYLKQRIERLGQTTAIDEADQTEDQMSYNRINSLQREFEMMSFCFNASTILFKDM